MAKICKVLTESDLNKEQGVKLDLNIELGIFKLTTIIAHNSQLFCIKGVKIFLECLKPKYFRFQEHDHEKCVGNLNLFIGLNDFYNRLDPP